MRLLSLAFFGVIGHAATHVQQSLENAKMWGNVRHSDKTGGIVIQDEYIVMFERNYKEKFGATFKEEHMAIHPAGAVEREWDSKVVKGYVVKMDGEMAAKVAAMPGVQYVEEHGIAFALDCAPEIPIHNGVWGTIRINNRDLVTSGDYFEELGNGNGVNSYVVDTGIDRTHPAFQGRALFGKDFVGEGDNDKNGHGTHVAGTIIGAGYGVAQEGYTTAVKVLNGQGSGTFANVISGIIWTGADAQAGRNGKGVSNLSLGGGFSQAVNDAIEDAWENNVISVVAAGNSNALACQSSPAAAYHSICVGSTDIQDRRSSFSNYGCCVDLYAPGTNILSTTPNGGTSTYSGTSMASPHIAGIVQAYWSRHPEARMIEIKADIIGDATPNKITGGTFSADCAKESPHCQGTDQCRTTGIWSNNFIGFSRCVNAN